MGYNSKIIKDCSKNKRAVVFGVSEVSRHYSRFTLDLLLQTWISVLQLAHVFRKNNNIIIEVPLQVPCESLKSRLLEQRKSLHGKVFM